MASTMAKNMEQKLYAMISNLADKYGFDADEAFEYVSDETCDIGAITGMLGEPKPEPKKKAEAPAPAPAPVEKDGSDAKIAECEKNIALWQKKLDEGKVKDADAQKKKIEKEKAKLAKLQATKPKIVEAPKVEEPKKEEPKPAPKKEKVETEKRMKRMSPTEKKKLAEVFTKVSAEIHTARGLDAYASMISEKGVTLEDETYTEYKNYINDLTDYDFKKSSPVDHMRDFIVKIKFRLDSMPSPKTEVDELVEEIEKIVVGGPSNAAGDADAPPVVLTPAELQAIKQTVTVPPDASPEYLYDTEKGRKVKGPESDDDEDFVEVKFEGKEYVVGEKTTRVYEARDTGDVFAGWLNVGKFKGMKMP